MQGHGYDVRVTRDVRYGTGRINVSSEPTDRALRLDVYEPIGAGAALRPALIMAFGGAFHRGSKESDEFDGASQRNTPVAEYCRAFAARGYAAFSIDYRLIQEDPDPGETPVIQNRNEIPRSRLDYVRELLGLPPATPEMIWSGIEAACDDMAAAFRFVTAHADRYLIDVKRVAVGGFSAGARTALAAAYGEHLPAAAVVSLSGYMSPADLRHWVTGTPGEPSAFLASGEHDLDYIAAQAVAMHAHFESVGTLHESWHIAGASHFYPATSTATRTDGVAARLDDAISTFLMRSMQGSTERAGTLAGNLPGAHEPTVP